MNRRSTVHLFIASLGIAFALVEGLGVDLGWPVVLALAFWTLVFGVLGWMLVRVLIRYLTRETPWRE